MSTVWPFSFHSYSDPTSDRGRAIRRGLCGRAAAGSRHVGVAWRRDDLGSRTERMSQTSRMQIELAPAAHVTAEMRGAVLAAVQRAGLFTDGWLQLPGEAKPEDWPSHRVAAPSLGLVLTAHEASATEVVIEQRSALGEALASIREQFPSLPLGIRSESAARKRWWGFRPTASPADIRRGMDATVQVDERSSDALGWDETAGFWVPM